jgi:hypothetical protein
MSRFSETEVALVARLRELKAAPDMSFNLGDSQVFMQALGFSHKDTIGVLDALEQDKLVAYGPSDRLIVLKTFPEYELASIYL